VTKVFLLALVLTKNFNIFQYTFLKQDTNPAVKKDSIELPVLLLKVK